MWWKGRTARYVSLFPDQAEGSELANIRDEVAVGQHDTLRQTGRSTGVGEGDEVFSGIDRDFGSEPAGCPSYSRSKLSVGQRTPTRAVDQRRLGCEPLRMTQNERCQGRIRYRKVLEWTREYHRLPPSVQLVDVAKQMVAAPRRLRPPEARLCIVHPIESLRYEKVSLFL